MGARPPRGKEATAKPGGDAGPALKRKHGRKIAEVRVNADCAWVAASSSEGKGTWSVIVHGAPCAWRSKHDIETVIP